MEILRCLLLPISGKTLIVPYAAVAEVVALTEAESFSKSNDWILGEFNWRNLKIPLVSLEMTEEASKFIIKPNLHVAIFNRISEAGLPDFIGVVLQNLPVMHRIKRSDVVYVAKAKQPYLIMEVKAREKAAFIPNIPWIEEKLAKFKA